MKNQTTKHSPLGDRGKKPAGYTLPYYTVVYTKSWMKKKFHAVKYGWNNEPVWTSQKVFNKKDIVDLLYSWYPGILIKYKTAKPPAPRLVKS